MSSKNHIEIAEGYEAMKLDLARSILNGTMKAATPIEQEFRERWAERYIEWRKANYRGRAPLPTNEAMPKANGQSRVKGEAKANDLPAEDPNQGRLF